MGRVEAREALLDTFSPKQKVIFTFLEYLEKLESEIGEKAMISWQHGRKTTDLLTRVYEGNVEALPLPDIHQQITFSWLVKEENGSVVGSSDVRIYNQDDCIEITANYGTMRGMEKYCKGAFDNTPIPVLVTDRHGYSYSNPAGTK